MHFLFLVPLSLGGKLNIATKTPRTKYTLIWRIKYTIGLAVTSFLIPIPVYENKSKLELISETIIS